MALGTLKCDTIENDSSQSVTVATLANLDTNKANLSGATFTGDVTLNAQQELRLADSDSSNYVALKAPATVSSNVTLTLPTTDGNADEFLQTNGSGALTWAAAGGKVLQMASTRNSTVVSSSATVSTYTAASTDGAQCAALTLTRQSSTSVMMIWANMHGYVEGNNFGATALFAGTTAVACSIGNGYSADAHAGCLFGSVTSASVGSGAVVYQLRNIGTRSGYSQHINAGYQGSGAWGTGQTHLVVMEVEP